MVAVGPGELAGAQLELAGRGLVELALVLLGGRRVPGGGLARGQLQRALVLVQLGLLRVQRALPVRLGCVRGARLSGQVERLLAEQVQLARLAEARVQPG